MIDSDPTLDVFAIYLPELPPERVDTIRQSYKALKAISRRFDAVTFIASARHTAGLPDIAPLGERPVLYLTRPKPSTAA